MFFVVSFNRLYLRNSSEHSWAGLHNRTTDWIFFFKIVAEVIFTGAFFHSFFPFLYHTCPVRDFFLSCFASTCCAVLFWFLAAEIAACVSRLCCRDSCWWAGERHLFYCPHRRETINAFLPPTPSPSSLQKHGNRKVVDMAEINSSVCCVIIVNKTGYRTHTCAHTITHTRT